MDQEAVNRKRERLNDAKRRVVLNEWATEADLMDARQAVQALLPDLQTALHESERDLIGAQARNESLKKIWVDANRFEVATARYLADKLVRDLAEKSAQLEE